MTRVDDMVLLSESELANRLTGAMTRVHRSENELESRLSS